MICEGKLFGLEVGRLEKRFAEEEDLISGGKGTGIGVFCFFVMMWGFGFLFF